MSVHLYFSEIKVPRLPTAGSRLIHLNMAYLLVHPPALGPRDGNHHRILAVYSRILCTHGGHQFCHCVQIRACHRPSDFEPHSVVAARNWTGSGIQWYPAQRSFYSIDNTSSHNL